MEFRVDARMRKHVVIRRRILERAFRQVPRAKRAPLLPAESSWIGDDQMIIRTTTGKPPRVHASACHIQRDLQGEVLVCQHVNHAVRAESPFWPAHRKRRPLAPPTKRWKDKSGMLSNLSGCPAGSSETFVSRLDCRPRPSVWLLSMKQKQ